MVSNKFYNDSEENRYWALWEISMGSMICFCCVVFLGLKFKWFRAQLKLGESPKNSASSPVQGVGFKMKSNPDDFQVYKVISEFAPVTSQVQQKPQINKNIIGMTAESTKPSIKISQNASKKPENKNVNGTNMTAETVMSSTNNITQNSSKKPQMNKPVDKNVNGMTENKNATSTSKTAENKSPRTSKDLPEPPKTQKNQKPSPKNEAPHQEIKPILKNEQKQGRYHNNTVNFDSEVTEISNPSDVKYSDLINNKKPADEVDEYQQITKVPQQSFQTKNPLATRSFTMPVEDEDDWKIKIVDEKPKPQPKKQESSEYFVAPSTNITSNMYSTQAASIFFAGQAPVAQPRARKFVEMDEDDIVSNGSQTSA